jgi:hypothetical protein
VYIQRFKENLRHDLGLKAKDVDLIASQCLDDKNTNQVSITKLTKRVNLEMRKLLLLFRLFIAIEKEVVLKKLNGVKEFFTQRGLGEEISKDQFLKVLAKIDVVEENFEDMSESTFKASNVFVVCHEYFESTDMLSMGVIEQDFNLFIMSENSLIKQVEAAIFSAFARERSIIDVLQTLLDAAMPEARKSDKV